MNLYKILFLFAVITASGCTAPPVPPEVKLAEEQELNLWRSGATTYTSSEYTQYRQALQEAQEELAKEKARFAWFQDFELIGTRYRNILKQGNDIDAKIREQKSSKAEGLATQLSFYKSKVETLKGLTGMINEGRLARRDLVKAELLLMEAANWYEQKDFGAAEDKMIHVSAFIKSAEGAILPILNRYADRDQIKKWQRWVEETVAESRQKKIISIVVNKSERTLVIYKNGSPFRTYNVGLGRNGSHDKIRAGDNATPEGKYKIIKKVPNSRYHKALLINYPNEEDKKQFMHAKENGIIPSQARIGGLIEIHGGGKDTMTFGCIGLDNGKMDEIYNLADLGTPVTIVGAVDYKNSLSSAIEGL